jgi:hypothetical protein
MTAHVLPEQKKPKLFVVVAFDRGEEGELFPAFGPTDKQSEERAVRTAKRLSSKHIGGHRLVARGRPCVGRIRPSQHVVLQRRRA